MELGVYNHSTTKLAPPAAFDLEVLDLNGREAVANPLCGGFVLFQVRCVPWEGEYKATLTGPEAAARSRLVRGGCAHEAAVGDSRSQPCTASALILMLSRWHQD